MVFSDIFIYEQVLCTDTMSEYSSPVTMAFEFQRNAFGSGHGGRNLEQSKFDRDVSTEHLPRSYAEKHSVCDLTRRSGYRDGYGRNTHCRLLTCRFHDCPFYNAVRTVSTLVE